MINIAMIDDDPDDQFFYKRLFMEVNNKIIFDHYYESNDFFKSIEKKDRLPNLILLDLNMPITSGFDFIKLIKAKKGLVSIPIIVLTTSSSPMDIQDCKDLGITSYFVKQMDYEDCKEMVKAIYQYWFKFNQLGIKK